MSDLGALASSQAEREVTLLFLWREFSYTDGASSLGIPTGAVHSTDFAPQLQ